MRRFCLIVLFFLTVIGTAQEDQTPPPNGMTIHVVQRGETLSQIALQYGITMEALITANSLINPDNIQVGQRLVIPGTQSTTIGMIITHTVQPGETLTTIAAKYNSTVQSIAELNKIIGINSLYIGQDISVTVGATGTLPSANMSIHIVQQGDTLMKIAAMYQILLFKLMETNQLALHIPLQIGQALIIPDSDAGGQFVSLPAPMLNFELLPLPATQGQTIHARVITEGESTITGKMLDRTINFSPDGSIHHAMIGIHAFTEPGIYPLEIKITGADGTETTYTTRLKIDGGGYGQETIDIPPENEGLLAPEIVQAELERVTTVMSAFTPQRYFFGLMRLPSTGAVTSQFGTRRSYDGSGFNTFHGGADFGGAIGSLIYAPADGMVVLAEPLQVRGNTVIVDHGWGVYTGYWHQTQIYVVAGQPVKTGDIIGTLGATGLVTGAHLHWEMWVGGVQVNPLQWLSTEFVPASE